MEFFLRQFQYIPDSFCQLFNRTKKYLAHSPNDPTQLFIQRIKILNIKHQILMDTIFFCVYAFFLVQMLVCQVFIGEDKV